MLELALKSLLSYLLGSLVGALIVGKLRGGVDIRTVGSGNAGGTNALRTHGKVFAFWVMVIDIGKGALAASAVPALDLSGLGAEALVSRDWLIVICAAAAIVGHVYPVWFGFRGGKGAATLIGAVLGISPFLLVPLLAVWLIVVMVSGYVGLGTICASAILPVYVCLANDPIPTALLAFGIFTAVFVTFTHRSNIARMVRGEENRARSLWLLKR